MWKWLSGQGNANWSKPVYERCDKRHTAGRTTLSGPCHLFTDEILNSSSASLTELPCLTVKKLPVTGKRGKHVIGDVDGSGDAVRVGSRIIGYAA